MVFFKYLKLNKFVKSRVHIGSNIKDLRINVGNQILGLRHKIVIFDLEFLWKNYRYFFFSLKEYIYKRSLILTVFTNPGLSKSFFKKFFYLMLVSQRKRYNPFIVNTILPKGWPKGLLTNTKGIQHLIKYIYNYPRDWRQKHKNFMENFEYVSGQKTYSIFDGWYPDFVLSINKNELLYEEALKENIPVLGLIDSNVSNRSIFDGVFSNNQSIESVQFFLHFLNHASIEGLKKEKELFYFIFLRKLKKFLVSNKIRNMKYNKI